MFKNVRALSIVAILLAVIVINVAAAPPAAALAASDLPCYDMWQRCLDNGHSGSYCDGVWCGCMESTYGYLCDAQVAATQVAQAN